MFNQEYILDLYFIHTRSASSIWIVFILYDWIFYLLDLNSWCCLLWIVSKNRSKFPFFSMKYCPLRSQFKEPARSKKPLRPKIWDQIHIHHKVEATVSYRCYRSLSCLMQTQPPFTEAAAAVTSVSSSDAISVFLMFHIAATWVTVISAMTVTIIDPSPAPSLHTRWMKLV